METYLVNLTNTPYTVNVSPILTGTWNSSSTYQVGQMVLYANNGYIAIQSVPANKPPDVNTAYWTKMFTTNFTAGSSTPPAAVTTAFKSNSSVSIPFVSTLIADTNTNRNQIWVCNDSGAVMYLSYGGPAVSNTGIRLNPNGGTHTSQLFKGAIYAIVASGTSADTVGTITVVEV